MYSIFNNPFLCFFIFKGFSLNLLCSNYFCYYLADNVGYMKDNARGLAFKLLT